MYRYEKISTSSTPYILVDEEKKYMKLSGESFPENVIKCYGEVAKWLFQFLKTDFEIFTFDCNMIYFNSSTSKVFIQLFQALNEAGKTNKVIVNWTCSEDNEIMVEYGEEFQSICDNIEFHIRLE
ncbi:DUF1987 domain-containing protein [Velocimicrobium porci]|uniref:DUF1987 domain-containing protein n=1 Tax=Velocimicrobium porci TaxID=2606634 RepID=A0A6L5XWE1_9FIRM|nr:DUF1987 domain-containing protein [Velocimicrobium porci]MSS63062.1 DUF1987 domain-containing protein [Velocimicrobium porci]